MKKQLIRMLGSLFGLLSLAGTSSAYYYYVHFPSRTGPFTPILEKFDLSALPNKTVHFFISDAGPAATYPGDSFLAVISEIRSAASVWNAVPTSDIRLAYGGLFTAGSQESTPEIDVEFSTEIPPGILALGGPRVPGATTGGVTNGPNGQFVPIIRSKVLLPADLSQTPSFSEQFFVTLVHEFGHTLGLQHTMTSSVMSTAVTSASSKAAPLGADDIAGISLLYPAAKYLSTVATISGQVTMNGNGLNLASVVAIAPNLPAISALTNPDGTYQIIGITPGVQYYVYAHALPGALLTDGENTPANIAFPVDSKGSSAGLQPNYSAFATQFYPNASDWTQAVPVTVATTGAALSGINFSVSPRSAEAVYSVRTYGYSASSVPEASPPLLAGTPAALVAGGPGLLQNNNAITPGLNIGVLGAEAQIYDLQAYSNTGFALLYAFPNNVFGPEHLLFYTPNDVFVLPSAFTIVANGPPWIQSITPGTDAFGNLLLAIAGTNLSSNTNIIFDGLPVPTQAVASNGSLLVVPPQAPNGYTATVAALNPDGQSSLFLQGQTPTTYTYTQGQGPQAVAISPQFLLPGADMLVDVVGLNTNFVTGQTVVGFGSNAIVKSVTVFSPTHLTALVTPTALASTNSITITTGLDVIAQALGSPVAFQ